MEKYEELTRLFNRITRNHPDAYLTYQGLSCASIIRLLLLEYGYITREQYFMLFPNGSVGELSALTGLWPIINKHRISPLITEPYIGNSVCYRLGDAGYRQELSKLIPEYICGHHLRAESPFKGKKNLIHAVETRNLPYRLLSDDQYGVFEWFSRVRLIRDVDLTASLEDADDRRNHFGAKPQNSDMLIPDGVIRFCEGEGGVIFLEQDMGQEKSPVLRAKHEFYGKYLAGQSELLPRSAVVYTVTNFGNGNSKKGGGHRTGGPSYAQQLLQCKDIWREGGVRTLAELQFLVIERVAGISDRILCNRYRKCADLLSLYSAEGGRALACSSIGDLDGFVKSRQKRLSEDHKNVNEKKNLTRCREIRRGLLKWLEGGSPDASAFLAAVMGGASYVVMSRNQVIDGCEYVLLRESGAWHSPANIYVRDYDTMRAPRIGPTNIAGIMFRNVLRADKLSGQSEYLIAEEVSCDVGGLIRIRELIRRADELRIKVRLLLYVASPSDARNLFDFTVNRPNITYAYIDYSSDPTVIHECTVVGERSIQWLVEV